MATNDTKLNEALAKRGLSMRHTRTAKTDEDYLGIREENKKVRSRVSRLAGFRVSKPGLLALMDEEC
jgi:hypothetical protein